MLLLLLFTTVFCTTLIIPRTHLNHRLSYGREPRIVNNAITDILNIKDYFEMPEELVYLSNSEYSMCNNKTNNSLYKCLKSIKSMVWKIENLRREVRFRDPRGKCLSVGQYDPSDDSYGVELRECNKEDEDQIFILHGEYDENGLRNSNKNENILLEEMKEHYGKTMAMYDT